MAIRRRAWLIPILALAACGASPPEASTREPVAPTTEPVAPTTEPVAPMTEPVATTAGSEATTAGSEAPVEAPRGPVDAHAGPPAEYVRTAESFAYDPRSDVVYALAPHARAFDAATGAPRWAARRATGDRLDLVDGRVVVTTWGSAPSVTVLSDTGRIEGHCAVPLANPADVGSLAVVGAADRVVLDLTESMPVGGAPIERPAPVCMRLELVLRGCRVTPLSVPCAVVVSGPAPSPRADRTLELLEPQAAAICGSQPVTLRVTAGASVWEQPLRERPGPCPAP